MIISEATVQLQSSHRKTTVTKESESFRAWVDGSNPPEDPKEKPRDSASFERIVDRVKLSAESLELAHRQMHSSKMRTTSMPDDHSLMKRLKDCANGKCDDAIDAADSQDPVMADSKLNLMKQLVEMLSGKKVRVFDPSDLKADTDTPSQGNPNANASETFRASDAGSPPSEEMPKEGWGVSYDYSKTTLSQEETRFEAQGVVQTRDGREIQFSSELQMERERIEVTSFQLRAGDAQMVDPLILNFDGNAAELTDEKMNFDLDSNGTNESISFVAQGSGFLVHDRNGDGVANNGAELFGPSTGNGFSELATHDDDGNGWIDEADTIYDNLRIWQGTATHSSLTDLRSANVGAIYLGSATTPFENRSSDGTLLGQTAATGVFLSENGQVGTVQQVDLVS